MNNTSSYSFAKVLKEKPMKLIFAGTPDFAVTTLAALRHESSHEILAVLTQPDRPSGRGRQLKAAPVKAFAQLQNFPILQPKTLRDLSIQQQLTALKPDLILVVAYGLILPKSILQLPPYGCLNIHASLLPRWRGAAPIQHAILAGDDITGITIMQMDSGLDTGDMLCKSEIPITDRETSASLHDKLASLGAKRLLATLTALEQQRLSPEKQNEHLATLAPKIQKQDGKINWNQSATAIDRKIRAFNPYPIAFSQLGQQTIRIFAATPLNETACSAPGTIVRSDKEGIDIATRDAVLRVSCLQLPGSKPLLAQQIIHSKRALFTPGAKLE